MILLNHLCRKHLLREYRRTVEAELLFVIFSNFSDQNSLQLCPTWQQVLRVLKESLLRIEEVAGVKEELVLGLSAGYVAVNNSFIFQPVFNWQSDTRGVVV